MSIVTKENIKSALTELGIQSGDLVVFHSSLKSMGHVVGGPQTVIDAFLEQVGPDGTIVVPTLLNESYPVAYEIWDKENTPSEVGLITEVFRTMPGSLRSDQATHSAAAYGKMAEQITQDHSSYGPRVGCFGDYAFSYGSPWQKLYEQNAKMVFIGVSTLYGTMRHLAEYVAVEKVLQNHPDAESIVEKYNSYGTGAFWPYIRWRPFEELFRNNGQLRSSACGNTTFLSVAAKTFVDTELEYMCKDPVQYTDLKPVENAEWIRWMKEIDDYTVPVWNK